MYIAIKTIDGMIYAFGDKILFNYWAERKILYTEHVIKFETMYLYFIKCFFCSLVERIM